MEYVEGTTLSRLVHEKGPLPVGQACNYIRQAADALQHAHEHGLVHRDLKPSNLLLTPDGQVKMLDLGLARLREEPPPGDEVTTVGRMLGTPDYMAPEQATDPRRADVRSDLYSLGCTLYFLLAGRPPFPFGTPTDKAIKHATEDPLPVRQLRPDVPPELAAVLDRLLAKDPARRYPTPAALGAALEPFAQSTPGRVRRAAGRTPGRRRRWVGLALAAACLAGLAALPLAARRLLAPAPVPPALSAPNNPAPAAELHMVSLHVQHYRGEQATWLGELGQDSAEAREDDDVRVSARLSIPAYCYLVAFNADGKEQPCLPRNREEAPLPTTEVVYPQKPKSYFGLTDGAGLQAFVLVASRQPLPPYARWEAAAGAAPWRAHVAGGGVWQFDGGEFELLPRERGTECQRGAPPWPRQDLCAFFKGRPGVEALRVLAFPVKPKGEKPGEAK